MANTKFDVILKMPFLKLSDADMSFGEKTLTWRSYITSKALPTTKRVQIIEKKDFIIAAFDFNSKGFVIYVTIQEQEEMAMDPARKAKIEV